MYWPFWIVGTVVGATISAAADALNVPTWETVTLILASCTAITAGATKIERETE